MGSHADRQKKYREKKKDDPVFRDKERKRYAEIRLRQKENQTEEEKQMLREKTKMRVRKYREQKKADARDSEYKSVQSRGKAVAKVVKQLPKDKAKRIEVLSIINEQTIGIPLSPTPPLPTQNPALPNITKTIQDFYRSDTVSQVSSETKHRRSKKRQDQEIRILTLTVMEAHAVFRDEYPNLQCSLSVFFKLRPETVLLMKQASYNVCLCSQHENFKFKVQAMNQVDPNIFGALKSLSTIESVLICDPPGDDCYLSKCRICSEREKLSTLYNQLSEDKKNSLITWYEWKAGITSGFKQVSKMQNESSVTELFDIIVASTIQFLLHIYIQRTHIEKFKNDKEQALQHDSSMAVLQIDFAENYRCFEQNATQGGHFGYKLVTFLLVYLVYLIYNS